MDNFLPDNYIFISHLNNIEGKDFRYWRLPVAPESISDTMSSDFRQTTALGRSAPVYTYSSSGPRVVRVELLLRRDSMDEINSGASITQLVPGEDYVDNLIHALQAISVPKYNLSNKAVEPPLVALRLGQQVFIKGVVSSAIGIRYDLPILRDGKYASVSMALEISEVDPYDATTVFQNGSFRGLVKTMRNGMGMG